MRNDRYYITQWYGIPETFIVKEDGSLAEDRLLEMFDAGLNLITIAYESEINQRVLEFCGKHGVKCTIEDKRMYEVQKLGDGWETLLQKIVDDYKDYPATFNYHILDEPSCQVYPVLEKISSKLLELDPVHEPYINLYPNYASAAQLGAATYQEYVEQFVNEVKPTLISYDHYHFCKKIQMEKHEFATDRDRMIYENAFLAVNRAGFFDNIEQIRSISLAHGLPYMIIILLVEHGSYRYLTEAELRWEVFQGLAYGSSLISYFTYWTPFHADDEVWHWKEAMISADGEKCQHYYDVKKINEELQKMGNQLLGASSEAVFHIGACEENVTFFNGYAGIRHIDVPAATIGFFDNGMAVIANKDYEKASEVVFDTDQVLQLFDKKSGIWKVLNDKKLLLAAGDGELIRMGEAFSG